MGGSCRLLVQPSSRATGTRGHGPALHPHPFAARNHAEAAALRAFGGAGGGGARGADFHHSPSAVYDAFGSAKNLSTVYFIAGVVTLFWGLMVPRLTQIWPRRWVYSAGCGLYLVAMALFIVETRLSVQIAILVMGMATVTCFVCFNAYVLDYVARSDLGRTQSLQMVYAAAPWAIGPLSGVWLRGVWGPLPFLVAGAFAVLQVAVFLYLRLGDGRQITKAKGPAGQSFGLSGAVFPATKADCGLALRGDPQLRLVGLCGPMCRFTASKTGWGKPWAA